VAVVTVFFLSRNLWRPLAGSLPFVIPVQLTRNAAKVPVNAAAISPNGAYLAYLDETGLYILDRQSGVKQAVKLPQEDNFLLASTNWDLAWSQDSSRVYAAGPSSIEQTANLWLFPLLASVPKRILGNVEAESIAADGKIAYIDAKTEEQIWIAGPNGEAPHRIITAPAGNSFAQVAWSPQGTRLSFIKETNDHDVLGTIDTETGETTEVLTGMSLAAGPQRYYSGLCWTKDGRIIFVAANPGGAMSSNLWQVKVDPLTGAKLSEPSPLTQEPATLQSDLSVTSDGNTLAFIRYDETDRVQLGRTAAGSSEFVKLESFAAEEGNNWSNHWTPDSSNLLFASDRRQGVRNVYKQGPNDKSPTPINPSDEIQQGAVAMSGTPLIAYWSWSPTDGDSPSKKWLNVMNLRDGSIHRAEHLPDTEIACALRAKTCILKSTPGNSGPLFSEIDLQTLGVTNLPRPKAQIAKVSDWDISPDASTIAIVDDDYTVGRVWLIHTADGAVSKIDVVGWSGLDLIAWSADGKGIYLGSDTAKQSALLRTDLAGDADVLWKNQTEGLDGEIAPSPNGDYVAFTTTSTAEANVWLLQKF
jgi:Tol biopolymer transport system component